MTVEVFKNALVFGGGLGRHRVRGRSEPDCRFAGSCHAITFQAGDPLRVGQAPEFSLNSTTAGLDLSMQSGRRRKRNVLLELATGKDVTWCLPWRSSVQDLSVTA